MSPARGRREGDHETFDELAVGWALHALEPEDEAVFARHLPDCRRCARTVAETGEVMAALAADLPPAEPSEDLRSRLRAAIEDTEQVRRPAAPQRPAEEHRPAGAQAASGNTAALPPVSGFPPAASWPPAGLAPPMWRRRLPRALVAAVAAVAVGLGVWNIVLGAEREQAQATVAAQAEIIRALTAPGQATIDPVSDHSGHTVATVVARQGQAQVVTWGLSMNNTRTTTYVLWGMRKDTPVALGTFDVVEPGVDLRTVGSDQTGLNGYSAYAISIESGRKAPARPTDIVANGQVTS